MARSFGYKLMDFFMRKGDPIRYARWCGVHVGKNCKIVDNILWGDQAYLITIGDNTGISYECAFITHDGGTWAFRRDPGCRDVQRYGAITVGKSCFIGCRSIILPGVEIGDRAIIGAGSVVSRSVPAGEVWAGNPIRYICKTEDYKRKIIENMPPYDMEKLYKDKKSELLKFHGGKIPSERP